MTAEEAAKRLLVDPFATTNPIKIKIAHDESSARSWMKEGYCPVECSYGNVSVVDDLRMDHHGSLSELEGVAIRAYRDHYGARAEKPWFVVTGTPDEDATFAIAALAGKIPHPSLAEKFVDSSLKQVWCQNFQHVAEIINKADIDPKGINLLEDYWGKLIVFWRETTNMTVRDVSAFHAGIVRWRDILTTTQDKLIQIVPSVVESSLAIIRAAPFEEVSKKITVVDCSQWGFSYTYAAEWHKKSPIVLAFYGATYGRGHVTFSARNKATAQKLFGDKGFLSVYSKLGDQGFSGCGGREDIGGSNRDTPLGWEQAIDLGEALDKLVLPISKKKKEASPKKKTTKKKDPKDPEQ